MQQNSTLPTAAGCLLGPLATPFDLGVWAGKVQAFAQVATLSASARAECLKQIRENRGYQAMGLTWEQFCTQHVGITRSYADRLIQRLEQFGKPYFDLMEIAPISADKYRAIAPAVSDQGIEIDGEVVPLTAENALRIRKAVESLRADLRRAQELRANPTVTELVSRFDSWFTDVSAQSKHLLNREKQITIRSLTDYAINKLRDLASKFQDVPR
jgi:hypothetical protein